MGRLRDGIEEDSGKGASILIPDRISTISNVACASYLRIRRDIRCVLILLRRKNHILQSAAVNRSHVMLPW
jgi:hypothetical protein